MYDKFQQIIKDKGITAYRVAKDTGIPTSSFSEWKSGRSKPKIEKLNKIAKYLGVTLDDLIERDD